MRQLLFRLGTVAVAACAGVLIGTGAAAAVTPEQCESHGGFVDIVIDPNDSTRAVCTCRNDPMYDGMQVFGPHIADVGGAPWPVHCVGLDV